MMAAEDPATDRRGSPSTRLILVMLAVATFLYLLRRPTFVSSPAFFADDGVGFFKGAIEHGWTSIFEPWSAQIFFFQRVVAWVLTVLPVRIQPAAYMAAAVAVAIISCSIVLSTRWRAPVPISARFACVIALLCSPAVDETFGTLADIHWWLGIGLLLLGMLRDPDNRRTKGAELALVTVGAVSGFAALYALPSLAVRAIRQRSRHSLALVSIAVAGLVLQIVTLASSTRRGDIGTVLSQPVAGLVVLIKRVFAAAAFGDLNLGESWRGYAAAWWIWPVAVAIVVAFLVVWIRGPRLESAALVLTILTGWILALYAMSNPDASIDWLVTWPLSATRYFLVPIAALYVSLVLAWHHSGIARFASGVACVLLAAGIFTDYHLSPLQKVNWKPFAACVERAVVTCSTTIPPDWPLQIEPVRP